jgi:hypothetical protein
MDWKTEFTFDFMPLPPEKEEAYWAAIRYFAEVMFSDLLDPPPPPFGHLPQEGEEETERDLF